LRANDTFAALRHRNYRLWFLGQTISLAGSWMQATAQGYLVYQLTGSAAYLGLIGGIAGIPTILFMLFGGVAADRIPRRNLLIITQSTMMILAIILSGLAFTGLVQPWHILLLAFLLSTANAFDAPARVSFVKEMVPDEDMTNAIALNAMMFNIATVAGPSIAGITYSLVGPAWCFLINAVTFLGVIIALALMKIDTSPLKTLKRNAIAEIQEGFRYVRSQGLVLSLIGFMGLLSIFGLGLLNLLPVWAVEVLNGDVTTNGIMISVRGFGALIGALMLAALGKQHIRGKLWTIGSIGTPLTLLIFSWLRILPLSLVALFGVGWSFILVANNSNAIVQTLVPDSLRGRVMSIYTLVFFSTMPLGSLFAGFTAERIGAPLTAMISSIVLLILSVGVYIFIPAIRAEE